MAITVEMVVFMEDLAGSYGWSEKYYASTPDINAGRTLLEDLCAARAAILDDVHQVVAGRVSDLVVFNDSLLALNTPLTGEILTTPTVMPTEPWTALNMRIEAGAAHRGRKFLHGTTEDIYLANRHYDPANPHVVSYDDFKTFIIANLQLRAVVDGVPTMFPVSDVIYIRETFHKVGRPFDLLRGRRRT